jgi:3-dehydroquinate dehydratase/shikimate dehydrogenase
MASICVPVCVTSLSDLAKATRAAAQLADIVEIRLDCLPEVELPEAGQVLGAILKSIERPIILTLRPAEQGGLRSMSGGDRLSFRLQNSNLTRPTHADYWDIELDLALFLRRGEAEGNDVGWGRNWDRTICSYHDFAGIPEDLSSIYGSMSGTGSRILKIAVQADDAVDCLKLFDLLQLARANGQEMIAIAMGAAGVMTRVLGPSRGSFLTYASLDSDSGTAPGQVTVNELRDLYRLDQIDPATDIFGIIGQPVAHSLSPHIHNAAFAAASLNAVYIPFEVRDALEFIKRMAHPKTREIDWQLKGLSVTAPHKSMVMQCLDWVDVAAREMGAVNTIIVQDDEVHGYNTDAAGFIAPLRNLLPAFTGAKCAVIGTGGAARAAIWALQHEAADVTVFARDKTKAEFLSKTFGIKYQHLSARGFAGYDVLVNATQIGTSGHQGPATIVTADQLRGVRLAYDLVYNPLETRFLNEARAAGCQTIGGLDMLMAQAVEQFKLWTGKQPNVEVMAAAAKRRLGFE